MQQAIRVSGDGQEAFKRIFRLCLKRGCGLTLVSEDTFIVSPEVLEELSQNGTEYELVSLSEDEAKRARILSTLGGE